MLATGLSVTIAAFAAALAGTWWTLRNAERLGLIQAPNARSSHGRPTPTGGGIGIALGSLVAGGYAAVLMPPPAVVIVAAALGLAAIGLWDDIRPVRWPVRLIAQTLLLGAVAVTLLPLWAALPALLAGVLFINIFNFMDGIDGLAGTEAAFILFGAAALLGPDAGVPFWWLVALGAASLGFLVFNFPPARIFMGDAGSTLLGLTIAALAMALRDGLGLWTWLILAALFVADALVTLTRRLVQGERLSEAHRRHAYQILARRFESHRVVTLGGLVINVAWLLPLAALARTMPGAAPWLTILAYAPLVAGAALAGAGKRQEGEV